MKGTQKMLRIFLFGRMNLSIGAQTPEMTHTVQALFAYLVLHRQRSHPRELLAGVLWGDYPEKRAQNSLRTALWRLRRMIESEGVERGTYLSTTRTHALAFNCNSPYWLDVERFESGVLDGLAKPVSSMTDQDAAALEDVIALYNGDLLDGFYEEWVLPERERFYRLFLSGTKHLMRYYRHAGRYDDALICGRLILQRDPLQEDIHFEIMMLHAENGQRALAIRQFEICRETLINELGIEPITGIQTLCEQLRRGENVTRETATVDTGSMSQALNRLDHAVYRLDSAQRELAQAIGHVEYLLVQIRSRSEVGL
jgi:DNA-binding SARP family transcriptional activator